MSDFNIQPSDPSSLTTQQLWREIGALKELLIARIDSIEKAIGIAHDDMVRVPTEVQKQVGSLKELLEARLDAEHNLKEEKFRKVDQRFELIERARVEQKADSVLALEAALKSSKDLYDEQSASSRAAINKIESSTDRRFDSTSLLITQNQKNYDDKHQELKERMDRNEGKGSGLSAGWGYLVGAVGLISALIAIFFALRR